MTLLLPNSVFVHVPRTGGIWIREFTKAIDLVVLESASDKWNHASHAELPNSLRQLPSFAFVRHPLTWVISRWQHSLRISAYAEHRFHGVHSLFDACVKPTLGETLVELVERQPGLVGKTFREATSGVSYLFRMRDLPLAGCLAIHKLEGIEMSRLRKVAGELPKCNQNPQDSVEGLDIGLLRKFLKQEQDAVSLWEGAAI